MNTLDDFVAPVNDIRERDPLSHWRWLIGHDAEPLLLTAMGDMFIRRPSTGEIVFLDVLEGSISTAASSYEEWKSALANPDNFNRWFLPDFVETLKRRGLVLAEGQCYSPIHPPNLGGKLTPENIEVTSWRVHFCIASQIHRQTKNLPAGSKIERFVIEHEDTQSKPWWKFW